MIFVARILSGEKVGSMIGPMLADAIRATFDKDYIRGKKVARIISGKKVGSMIRNMGSRTAY